MATNVEEDIAKFKKKFDYNYQPIYGFCPSVVKTNIMEFYKVSFNEAIKYYNEISSYPSAIVRFNDYLFDNIRQYKTFDLKTNEAQ